MSDVRINISGLPKGVVLKALHDGTSPKGMGYLHAGAASPSVEDCQRFLDANGAYVDYFRGRPIKCDLGGDDFDPFLYDRDAGFAAAFRAINDLRIAMKEKA